MICHLYSRSETVARVLHDPGLIIMRILALACSCLFVAGPLLTMRAQTIDTKVNALFARWNRNDSPGCGVGVSRNGVPVLERGFGMASLEQAVAITTSTVFNAGSISKQFTAMSILLLAEQGKLGLDDQARRYVPELPDYGRPLTIRHLLTHTGGLRDVFLLLGLAQPHDIGEDPNATVIDMLTRQRGLNFAPGTDFEYNNGGYTLLGEIVKRVSGQSLRAFADANIFRPLAMADTHFRDDRKTVVAHRATAYHPDARAVQVALNSDPGGLVGNTGVFTTVRDLLRWEQNFAESRVGTAATVSAMQKPMVLTDGTPTMYGFGLELGRYRGLSTVGHSGSGPGVATYVVRYPDQQLAVAVLCNTDDADVQGLASRVADLYLPDTSSPSSSGDAAEPVRPVALSVEQLEARAGLYRDAATNAFVRLFVRDGRLMGNAHPGGDAEVFPLTPVSPTRFVLPTTPIAIEVAPASGPVQEMRATGLRARPFTLGKVTTPFAPSTADLTAFAGTYRSAELDVTYEIAVKGSSLVIHVPGRSDIGIEPVFPNAFQGSGVEIVEFSRGTAGTVTGFTLYAWSARGLRFERVAR
jgi:CubicO group peptidase (beta-lactamase class C family)